MTEASVSFIASLIAIFYSVSTVWHSVHNRENLRRFCYQTLCAGPGQIPEAPQHRAKHKALFGLAIMAFGRDRQPPSCALISSDTSHLLKKIC